MRLLLLALLWLAPPAAAGQVAAVLSSDLPAYRQALEAFSAALGTSPVVVSASADALPEGAKVVAAFGSAAARRRYPAGVTVVAVSAPGMEWEPRRPGVVVVRMVPRPSELAARASRRGVRRLGLAYMAPGLDAYAAALLQRGKAAGLEVEARRLDSADDLPDLLRSWRRKVDAVWLPPDPALVDRRSVLLVSRFAAASSAVFFSPTEALIEEGADGSLGVSPADMGRAAAAVASAALAGKVLEPVQYADGGAPRLAPPAAATETAKDGQKR